MTSTPPVPYGDYQSAIYAAASPAVVPALPMAYPELEARAAQALPPSDGGRVAGTAPDGPCAASPCPAAQRPLRLPTLSDPSTGGATICSSSRT